MKERAYCRKVKLFEEELVNFCLATGRIEIDDLENQDWSIKYNLDGSLEFTIWFETKEEFLGCKNYPPKLLQALDE